MTTTGYTVAGMTCGHCATSVTEEVREIPGVEQVDVVLETGGLTITSSGTLSQETVREAIKDAGYGLS